MIRIGSMPTTLQIDDFEELACLHDADVHLPGNRAGWATCTVLGHTYRARVAAPGVSR